VVFYGKTQCYRAKIYLIIFVKVRKPGENFGENFGKISEIPKIREKFPRKISRKFPENFRKTVMFFNTNTMLQSENLSFYFCKSKETLGKFRKKFSGNF
jgi:hypothetical protein